MKKIDQTNAIKKVEGDLKEIISKYLIWIEQIDRLLKSNSHDSNSKYFIVQNILITLINQKDILEFLLKNNIYDVNSYEWLKNIRHIWDSQNKEVVIECGGWSIFQHYNYIGNFERMLLTPQTDKIFLFFASCFREKSSTIIKTNISQDGYYEIFEEFANNLWIQIRKVYLSECSLYKKMTTLFDVCTMTNNWIFLENLSQLQDQSILYVSKMMQMIQQEIILDEIKNIEVSNQKEMKKMFCVVGCLRLSEKTKDIDTYLKSSCRIMNVITPDIGVFTKGMVKLFFPKIGKDDKPHEALLNFLECIQNLIRQKLNSFYYDFHLLNLLKNYLINKVIEQGSSSNTNQVFKLMLNGITDFLADILIGQDIKIEEVKSYLSRSSNQLLNYDVIKNDLVNLLEDKLYNKQLGNMINSFDMVVSDQNIKKVHYFYNTLINSKKIALIYGPHGCGKSKTIENVVNGYVQAQGKNVKIVYLKEVMFLGNLAQVQAIFNLLHESEYDKYDVILLVMENFESVEVCNTVLAVYNDYYVLKNLRKFRLVIEKQNLRTFDFSLFSKCNLISLEPVNWKKLQKYFLNNVKSNLKSMNVLINDEFYPSLLEFTKNVLLNFFTETNEKFIYYKIITLYNYIDLYLRKVFLKKASTPKQFLFNIFVQSLIFLCYENTKNLGHSDIIKYFQSNVKTYFKSEVTQDFLKEFSSEHDIFLDYDTLSFKRIDNFMTIQPSSQLVFFGKKEYSALYLLELASQLRIPFVLFSDKMFINNLVLKHFLKRTSSKVYSLGESSLNEIYQVKNKDVVLYLDDLNISTDGSQPKVNCILDYYCKEDRLSSATCKKPEITATSNKAFVIGESICNENTFQNSLLYKMTRYNLKSDGEIGKIFRRITTSEIYNKKFKSNMIDKNENLLELLQLFLNKFEHLFGRHFDVNHLMGLNTLMLNCEILLTCKEINSKHINFQKFIKTAQSLLMTCFYVHLKGSKSEQLFINYLNEMELLKEEDLSVQLGNAGYYIKEIPVEYKSMDNYKSQNLYNLFSALTNTKDKSASTITLIGESNFLRCFLEVQGIRSPFISISGSNTNNFFEHLSLSLSDNSGYIIFKIKDKIHPKIANILRTVLLYLNSFDSFKIDSLNSDDTEQQKLVNLFKNDLSFVKFIYIFENYQSFLQFSKKFPLFGQKNMVFELESNNNLFQSVVSEKFEKIDFVQKDDIRSFFQNFDSLLDKRFYENMSNVTIQRAADFLNVYSTFPNYQSFRTFLTKNKFKVMHNFIKLIDFFGEKFAHCQAKGFPIIYNHKTLKGEDTLTRSRSQTNLDENMYKDFKFDVEKHIKGEIETLGLSSNSDEKRALLLGFIKELEDLFGNLTDADYQKILTENLDSKDLKTINEFFQEFVNIDSPHSLFNCKINVKLIYSSRSILITAFKLISSLCLTKQQLEALKSKYKNEIITYSKFFAKNLQTKSNVVKLIYNIVKIIYQSLFGEEGSLFLNNYLMSTLKEKSSCADHVLAKVFKSNFEIDEKKLSKNVSSSISSSSHLFDYSSIQKNLIGDCLVIASLLPFEKRFSFDFLKEVSSTLVKVIKGKMINFTPQLQDSLEEFITFYYKNCVNKQNQDEIFENVENTKMITEIMKRVISIHKSSNNVTKNNMYNSVLAPFSNKLEESFLFKYFTNYQNLLKYLLLSISEKDKVKDYDQDLKIIFEMSRAKPFINETHSFLLSNNANFSTSKDSIHHLVEAAFRKLGSSNTFSKLDSYYSAIDKSKMYLEIKSFLDSLTIYRHLSKEICNKPSFIVNDFCNLYFIEKLYPNITPEQLAKKIYESIFFNVDNKFLLNCLITIDFLHSAGEISSEEQTFLIGIFDTNLRTNEYKCVQSLKHFNAEVLPYVNNLITHYKQTDGNQEILIILDLIVRRYDIQVIRNKIEGIKKKSKKLILLSIFQEEDFFSLMKYLVNKNLIEKYNVEKNKLNDFLNKKTYKAPILVKSEVFVNITNFLCSLASYYETEFIIVRNMEYIENTSFLKYNYIVDNNYKKVINKCYKEGGWLLISCGINLEKFVKIFNFYKEKPHQNFRLFVDANLVENDKHCKEFLSSFAHIVYIDSVCVDELEAAHDVWVNVLEEKIITETMINESVTENEQHRNVNANDVSTFSKFQFEPDGTQKEGKSYISDVKDIKFLTDELENKI